MKLNPFQSKERNPKADRPKHAIGNGGANMVNGASTAEDKVRRMETMQLGELANDDLDPDVEITRAVYSRANGQVLVDVFAEAKAEQHIRVTAARMAPAQLHGVGQDYFVRLATGPTVPARVNVENLSVSPPAIRSMRLTDALVVSSCVYDASAKTLSVDAASSDHDVPPALVVHGFGTLTNGSGVFHAVASPPSHVIVTSSAGGFIATDVLVTGEPTRVAQLSSSAYVVPLDGDLIDLRESALSK
jgi:hypothetical protein